MDDSICAMSSTPGTSAAGASRAVAQGQQGNCCFLFSTLFFLLFSLYLQKQK